MKTKSHLLALTICVSSAVAACSPDPAEIEAHGQELYGTSVGIQLNSGARLGAGKSLYNNGYELIMQSDCNLVLYDFKDQNGCDLPTHSRVLWASNTPGSGGTNSCYATMQADGNLVVYTTNARGFTWAVWASGTNGRANGGYLSMQTDGNAVIYAGGAAKWATNTNFNRSGATRRCPLARTYCCLGDVTASQRRVTASRCSLLTGSKTCAGGARTLTCNNYDFELLRASGELTCENF